MMYVKFDFLSISLMKFVYAIDVYRSGLRQLHLIFINFN